jgi:hypothetical protein
MSRLQGAVYVYYLGYPITSMSPPALIPTTLQPWHGSAITVESDAYRPVAAQVILFSSNRLDPTETYTITVTKTNETLNHDLNIDAFILTEPDGAESTTFSPGTNFSSSPSVSAADISSSSFVAQTTVISGTTRTGPVVSLGTSGATSTTSSGYSAPTGSITYDHNTNTFTNASAIAGGVVGGVALGTIIAFFVFCWWSRRSQQKTRVGGPDELPIQQFSDGTPRPVYFNVMAAAPYASMKSGAPPGAIMSAVTERRSVPSTFVHVPPLTPASIGRGRSLVSGHMEIVQVQETYIPPVQVEAQYPGNSQPNNLASTSSSPAPVVFSPEDTGGSEITLPAYSRH